MSAAILIVEDSDEDFDVLNLVMKQNGVENPLVRACDGLEAMKTLNACVQDSTPLPGLVILDLNLIGLDGREMLKRLNSDIRLKRIPVIVFSTSASPKDVEACYQNGAAAYAVKPVSLEKLENFVRALKAFWLDLAILPSESHIENFRRIRGG